MSSLNVRSSESKGNNFIQLKKRERERNESATNALIKFIGKKRGGLFEKEDWPSRSVKHGRGNIIKAKHFAFSTSLVFVSSLARAIDSRGVGALVARLAGKKWKRFAVGITGEIEFRAEFFSEPSSFDRKSLQFFRVARCVRETNINTRNRVVIRPLPLHRHGPILENSNRISIFN